MADEATTVRSINWREVFPFTNLFKAFRVAVHPSKLVLAWVALLLVWLGGLALDKVWPAQYSEPDGTFTTFFDWEISQVNELTRAVIDRNPGGAMGAIGGFLAAPVGILFKHPVFFFIYAAWFLLIWSIFGGAISRIAAVHIAREEKIAIRDALRFSSNKLLSFIFAPLIPLLILLAIAAVLALAGVILYHIPYIGPIVAGALFFLALIAGLVMALVSLGLVGGFNLMYPTIAVEGSDSFDAISRSFSYVFARPWRMVFYTIVSIVYGAITYLFVRFFIWLVLVLAYGALTWWFKSGGTAEAKFTSSWPPPSMFTDTLVYSPRYALLNWGDKTGAALMSFWVHLAIGLLGAYAISFYFSANSIIYYLMRREVDATELEDVYVEETEDEFAEAGVVAATATATSVTAIPAPAEGSTSAPGGGITGTAGSADPGGGVPSQSYTPPESDAPKPEGGV